ncbi:MAG: outer membrane beta-barrel protein, partial [Pedobacter sp.]|nr:outer membrane beta-barrel protein [Pedobacter sp.]
MIKIYLCLILPILSLSAAAQKTVSGKVVDEKSQTIPFASVTILRHTDSVKAHAAITDTAGNFSMPGVPTGNYLVKISYMGYEDYYTAVIALNQSQQPYHLGEIRLKADSRALNMVTISGQRPVIEQTLDRTIMNIEKSVLAEGNTAMELLTKAPGVTLSESGEVALKGRSGTAVMINGKPTYLSGDQLANLLRGTSSSAISRIEIMANPPAQYDAAGSGGIVNIILKKNTLSGFNGVVTGTIGIGRGLRYGEGISLNYRGGRVNLFGSYNANNQNIKTSSATERQFYAGNTGSANTEIRGPYLQRIFQEISEEAKLRSHNFRVGADINLNEHNTIGFLLNGAIGKYPTVQPGVSRVIRNDGTLLLNSPTLTENRENWEDLLYNLNYVHRFKKEGHELKVDLDYVSHFSRMEQQLDTRYLNYADVNLRESSGRRGNIPSYNDIYAGKVDYSLPLSKKSKLEAGWKGSDVRTENNLQYDTLQTGQY